MARAKCVVCVCVCVVCVSCMFFVCVQVVQVRVLHACCVQVVDTKVGVGGGVGGGGWGVGGWGGVLGVVYTSGAIRSNPAGRPSVSGSWKPTLRQPLGTQFFKYSVQPT